MVRSLLYARVPLLLGIANTWFAATTALYAEEPTSALPSASKPSTAELATWIDGRVASHIAENSASPELVNDATFLRRAYLDLLGTIPTVAQVRDFLDDDSPDKRPRLVDKLLNDERAALQLARTWRRIWLADNGSSVPTAATFETWLREQFANNVAYNQLAHQIVTAGGAEQRDGSAERENNGRRNSAAQVSPAAIYLQAAGGDPASVAGVICRDFLGVRIECAQCHDHPFANWKQDDFWGIAAFFAGARYTATTQQDPGGGRPRRPVDDPVTMITPPEVGRSFDARLLGDRAKAEIDNDKLPRQVFAEWLTSAENPHFAATAANRVWQQLCGRGLTASVDEIDTATSAERAVLLDDLAKKFAEHGFDMKWLIGGIAKSSAYQFAAAESESSGAVIGVRPLKVLSPEQVFDSLEMALGLSISRIDEGPRYNGQREQLVARLNEAASKSPDDFRAGIPQMLMLMNGSITAEATNFEPSRTLRAVIESPFLDDYEKIETLFLAVLTRQPTPTEVQQLRNHVAAAPMGEAKNAYSHVLWALINSPEFVLLR